MIPNSVGDAASFVFWGYLFGMFIIGPTIALILNIIIAIFPSLRTKVIGLNGLSILVAIMMVIYAGGSIALAVLITQGYNPLELPTTLRFRIALIIFAILQISIAAFNAFRLDVPQEYPLALALKFIAQPPAVYIAHYTSGWLETLFFA